jgi:hypothetical protein
VRVDANGTVRIFDGGTVYRRCTPDQNYAPQPAAPASWISGPPSPVRHERHAWSELFQSHARTAHDPSRDRVVLALYTTYVDPTNRQTWEWSGSAGTWTKRSDTAPAETVWSPFELAYDWNSARILGVGYDGTFAYDAAAGTWTKLSASVAEGTLFYEATTAALVAVSGATTSRWDAASLTWVPGPNIGATQPVGTALVADLGRRRVLAHTTSAMPVAGWNWTTIWEWSAAGGWAARTTASTAVPSGAGELVYAGGSRMAYINPDGAAWLWNTTTGAWTRTAAGPVYRLPGLLVHAGDNRVLATGYTGPVNGTDILPGRFYVGQLTWQLLIDQ